MHPNAATARVRYATAQDAEMEIALSITPQLSLPSTPAVAGIADGGADPISSHEWSRSNACFLFWAIPRTHEKQKTNCAILFTPCENVTTCGFGSVPVLSDHPPVVSLISADLPLMTNTKPITKGEAIVCFQEKAQKPTPKAKVPRTWYEKEKASERKDHGAKKKGEA